MSTNSWPLMRPPISWEVVSTSGDSPGDGHRLGYGSDLERQLDLHRGANLERDVATGVFLEPRELGGDFIHAGGHRAHQELAISSSHGLAIETARLVTHDHRHTRQQCTLLVHDLPTDITRALLRKSRRSREERGDKEDEYAPTHLNLLPGAEGPRKNVKRKGVSVGLRARTNG